MKGTSAMSVHSCCDGCRNCPNEPEVTNTERRKRVAASLLAIVEHERAEDTDRISAAHALSELSLI